MSDPIEDSVDPSDDWRKVPRFSVLDPSGTPSRTVYPTVYVTDELLIDTGAADDTALSGLISLAGLQGWTVDTEETGDGEGADAQQPGRPRGASATMRARVRILSNDDHLAPTPDAWLLLRQARDNGWGKRGISLHHVLTTDSIDVNPFKANPFKANPFKANPFKANALTVGIDSYAHPGFGGLQPVTYLGPEPSPRHDGAPELIVAILDTGWGQHPWLEDDVVVKPFLASGEPIGIDQPRTNPESEPSLAEPLDGIFDDAAGHGTFIAGIVRQACPDARILPVRVADGEGVIFEYDLLGALGRLIEFMDENPWSGPGAVDASDDQPARSKVAVLNLSFSYFHETPDDPNTISEIGRLLEEIRKRGCVVVCSAGNEATTRPTYPADIPGALQERHVAVGALNPSDHSVALFSNIGDWVDVYAPGVSIVSTIPTTFQGGLQAGTRDDFHGLHRETLDVDDFRGGFGVWSGTSFAAPFVAGLIAEELIQGSIAEPAVRPEDAKSAVLARLNGEGEEEDPSQPQ